MRAVLVFSVLFLSGCGVDKVLHAGAGLGVGVTSDQIVGDYGCEMAFAIGLAKEMIDPVFSTMDLIATSAYCILPHLENASMPDLQGESPAETPDAVGE